ncbi:MAG: hypothetical protein ACLFNM_01140 [Candidatus Woesearchaeota archaeon]
MNCAYWGTILTNDFSVSQIQTNMAQRLARDRQLDRTVDLLSLLQTLVTDKFGRVRKETLLFEAEQIGFGEDEVYALLDKLIAQHILKEDGEYVAF